MTFSSFVNICKIYWEKLMFLNFFNFVNTFPFYYFLILRSFLSLDWFVNCCWQICSIITFECKVTIFGDEIVGILCASELLLITGLANCWKSLCGCWREDNITRLLLFSPHILAYSHIESVHLKFNSPERISFPFVNWIYDFSLFYFPLIAPEVFAIEHTISQFARRQSTLNSKI